MMYQSNIQETCTYSCLKGRNLGVLFACPLLLTFALCSVFCWRWCYPRRIVFFFFFVKNTLLSCSFQERLVGFSQTNTLSSKKRMFVTTPLLLLLSFLNVSLSCGQRKVFPGLISGAARNSSQKNQKRIIWGIFGFSCSLKVTKEKKCKCFEGNFPLKFIRVRRCYLLIKFVMQLSWPISSIIKLFTSGSCLKSYYLIVFMFFPPFPPL